MIIFFTGTPGSGKTYEAVEKILQNLVKGKIVYTNIDGMEDPICHEAIKSVCHLTDEQFEHQFRHFGDNKEVIQNFWNHCEKGSFIVLDEVQKFFSNRDWQTKKNKDFGDWASTHRHEGYDLIIITQNAERIDSAVRALAEWNYVYRKVNFFGGAVQKKYIVYSYSGDETSGTPLSKEVRTYKNKIFLCYKSYVSKDIKEQGFMNHVNVLKHPIFYAIPVILGICIYMVFFKSSLGTGDIFGTAAVQAKKLASVQPANASITPSNPNFENPKSPSHVRTLNEYIQPSGSIPREDKPSTITRRIKLNTLVHYRPGFRNTTKILFDGAIYIARDFPYRLTYLDNQYYADIPLEYFQFMKKNTNQIQPLKTASNNQDKWND